MLTIIEIQKAVEKIAPDYPVKKVQLFGSYAEGLATEKSDVDILVEFSEWPVSALDFCGFQQEVADRLNTKVDMIRYPLSKDVSEYMTIQKVVPIYG